MATEDVLAELERWYLAQCDEEWEHNYGVVIGTLDNPGWQVSVDLIDTPLDTMPYERAEAHRTEDDWVVSWRSEQKWEAACGPLNLREALALFLAWSRSAPA